jgi:medium-chain acyl-[acyl-carrier-protein] hydrolase
VTCESHSRWIARAPTAKSESRAVRMFCFPFAGGGASIFRDWSQHLPAAVDVVPIQLPGRENRWGEDSYSEIGGLIRSLVDVLAPLSQSPYLLFGHSMGAIVSFELAREFRRRGLSGPVHLFVSSSRAPHLSDTAPQIHLLPDDEFVDAICRQMNGIPDEILQTPQLLSVLLPTLRADVKLCETYVYKRAEPLACPITAYGGVEDTKANPAQIRAWKEHTKTRFQCVLFPSGHFYFQNAQQRFFRVLSSEISRTLGLLST